MNNGLGLVAMREHEGFKELRARDTRTVPKLVFGLLVRIPAVQVGHGVAEKASQRDGLVASLRTVRAAHMRVDADGRRLNKRHREW